MGSSLCTADTTGDSGAREEGQRRRPHKLYRHQSPRSRERVLRLRNRQGRFAWMESRTREPDSRETRSDPSWSVRGGRGTGRGSGRLSVGFADVVVCVRYDVDSEPCQCSPAAQERSGVEEFPVPLEIRERQRTSSGRKIHVLEGVAGLC